MDTDEHRLIRVDPLSIRGFSFLLMPGIADGTRLFIAGRSAGIRDRFHPEGIA
jgi:hypothetical protein